MASSSGFLVRLNANAIDRRYYMAGRIPTNEREARKLYVHDRHRMVVTVIIAVMVLALVICIPTAAGLFDTKAEENAQPNYGVTAPCVATGTTAVDASKITVRVLNATDKSGLATAVANELQSRGFGIQGVDNYSGGTLERTEIRFGKNAIAEAYTLAGNVSDAIMRMDSRDDSLVDLLIGSSFYDLLDEDQVTTLPGSTLQSITGCVAADAITDVPEALPHDSVNATTTGTGGDSTTAPEGDSSDSSSTDSSSADSSSN